MTLTYRGVSLTVDGANAFVTEYGDLYDWVTLSLWGWT